MDGSAAKSKKKGGGQGKCKLFHKSPQKNGNAEGVGFCWDAAYGKQGGCIKHLIERRQRNAGMQPGETGAVGELCRADGVKVGSFREREIGWALGFRQG